MATVTARKVDDADYAALAESARENGRSISEEVRALIAEQARKRRGRKIAAELAEFRAKHAITLAPGTDAVSLIRAVRDEE